MKKHWYLTPLLLVLLSAPLLAQQPASRPHGRILGVVTADVGPLIAAEITLRTADTVVVARATTAQDGHFLIENVAFGKYSLRVSYLGYKERLIPNVAVTSAAPSVELGVIKLERQLIALLENLAQLIP